LAFFSADFLFKQKYIFSWLRFFSGAKGDEPIVSRSQGSVLEKQGDLIDAGWAPFFIAIVD
jgi:hypothetical protein